MTDRDVINLIHEVIGDCAELIVYAPRLTTPEGQNFLRLLSETAHDAVVWVTNHP